MPIFLVLMSLSVAFYLFCIVALYRDQKRSQRHRSTRPLLVKISVTPPTVVALPTAKVGRTAGGRYSPLISDDAAPLRSRKLQAAAVSRVVSIARSKRDAPRMAT